MLPGTEERKSQKAEKHITSFFKSRYTDTFMLFIVKFRRTDITTSDSTVKENIALALTSAPFVKYPPRSAYHYCYGCFNIQHMAICPFERCRTLKQKKIL